MYVLKNVYVLFIHMYVKLWINLYLVFHPFVSGWMNVYLCALVDRGGVFRKTDIPSLVDRTLIRDVSVKRKGTGERGDVTCRN